MNLLPIYYEAKVMFFYEFAGHGKKITLSENILI